MDTALNISGEPSARDGAAWFVLNPKSASITSQGYIAVACNVSVAQIAVVRGIDYLPGNSVPDYSRVGSALTQAELGPVFDTINTFAGGCSQPTQGNFSTFLPAGTTLYTFKGYPPSFRLAVKQGTPVQNQPISLLEAIAHPHASKGSELMQLDHVTSILLYPQSSPSSSPTTPPLAAARSPQAGGGAGRALRPGSCACHH